MNFVRILPQEINDPRAPDDLLLTPQEVCGLLAVSKPWLEKARTRGDGPACVYLSPSLIRYRLGSLRQYVEQRQYTSVAEAEAAGVAVMGGPGRGHVGVSTPRVLARRAAAEAAASAAQAEP